MLPICSGRNPENVTSRCHGSLRRELRSVASPRVWGDSICSVTTTRLESPLVPERVVGFLKSMIKSGRCSNVACREGLGLVFHHREKIYGHRRNLDPTAIGPLTRSWSVDGTGSERRPAAVAARGSSSTHSRRDATGSAAPPDSGELVSERSSKS